MVKEIKIQINTRPKFSAIRYAIAPVTQLLIIGVGSVIDNTAMQWAGFILFFLMLFAMAAINTMKNTAVSLAEARKIIDRLETEEIK